MTLDPDKLRDCLYDAVIVDGIKVTSRYQKEAEFRLMASVLSSLPRQLRRKIKSMDCNSQHTNDYDVSLRPGHTSEDVRAINNALHQLFVQQAGGHNGLCVEGKDLWGGWWAEMDAERFDQSGPATSQ